MIFEQGVTLAVTRGLRFRGLIRKTSTFSSLVLQVKGSKGLFQPGLHRTDKQEVYADKQEVYD